MPNTSKLRQESNGVIVREMKAVGEFMKEDRRNAILKIVALENAKHSRSLKSSFLGLFLCFLTITVGLSTSGSYTFISALQSTAIFLIGFGIPGISLLFGAMAGSGIQQASERAVEEALPVDPIAKVYGAFLSSFRRVLFLAIPALLLSGIALVLGFLSGPDELIDELLFKTIYATLICSPFFLQANLFAFIFGYMLRQSLLGVGLTTIFVIIELFFIQGISSSIYSPLDSPWVLIFRSSHGLSLFLFVLSLIAGHAILLKLANKMERGIPLIWDRLLESIRLRERAL